MARFIRECIVNKTRRANMSGNRKAGILCPVFSLSSKYGIGSFGESAYEFVRFLKKSKKLKIFTKTHLREMNCCTIWKFTLSTILMQN